MVSLPAYDNNQFSARDQPRGLQEAAQRSRQAAAEPRDQRPVPARLHVQARGGHRRPRGQQDHAVDADPDGGLPHPRWLRFRDWNNAGFGLCNIYCGFGHSSDTFFYRPRHARHRPARLLGASSTASGRGPGIDLPAEVAGAVPTNKWKSTMFDLPTSPARSTRPASARATTPSRRSSSSTRTPPSRTAGRSTGRRSWRDHRPRRHGRDGRARGRSTSIDLRQASCAMMRHAAAT